jgi:protein-S-isoprenylcysteine O-methyltransferase Ste14
MTVIGKETIHPVVFYSGKIAGYLTWILIPLSFFRIISIHDSSPQWIRCSSYAILALGLIVTTVSLFNLGRSTRLGLPKEQTSFKKNGLYRISRNPMYVGFNLLTIASMVFHLDIVVALLGFYSIFTYHLIIKGEEMFLGDRFGKEYQDYKAKVRRYL